LKVDVDIRLDQKFQTNFMNVCAALELISINCQSWQLLW